MMRIPIDLAHRAEIEFALNQASAAFAESEARYSVPVADPSALGDFCYVPDFALLLKATGEAEWYLQNYGIVPPVRPGCSVVMSYDLDTPEKNPTLGASARVRLERGDFSTEDSQTRYAQTGHEETGQWFLTGVEYDGCHHITFFSSIRLSPKAIQHGISSIATACTPDEFARALGDEFKEWHAHQPDLVRPAQMQLVVSLLSSLGMMNPSLETLLSISREAV